MQVQKKLSKNMSKARSFASPNTLYKPEEAVAKLKECQFVKFDSSIEICLKLGIDIKQPNQMVRSVVALPAGTGKSIRVAVVCKEEDLSSCKQADISGGAELIDEIANGRLDFDVCIATPTMMGQLGKVAKILGPKGLMPNPKLGTVTQDLAGAIARAKAGQIEFRSDKGANLNCALGKLSFEADKLIANIAAFMAALTEARPAGVKGDYVRSAYLSSTMGPSFKIDLQSLFALSHST